MSDMLTNGEATVIRTETCNGKPANWQTTVSAAVYCESCGMDRSHADHKYEYEYTATKRLGLTGPDNAWHELNAKTAFQYLSGELKLKTIASIMGVEPPYTLDARETE